MRPRIKSFERAAVIELSFETLGIVVEPLEVPEEVCLLLVFSCV